MDVITLDQVRVFLAIVDEETVGVLPSRRILSSYAVMLSGLFPGFAVFGHNWQLSARQALSFHNCH